MSVWSFSICWRAPAFLTALTCDLDSRWMTPCCMVGLVGQLEWSAGNGPQQLAQHGSDVSSSMGEEWVSSVWSLLLQMRHLGVRVQVRGFMVVPASCTLLYTGAKRLQLDLYVLAKEVDPFWDCLGLIFRDGQDDGAGGRVLG